MTEPRALPIFDVFVDLHHPATSFATSKANAPINAVFVAPPPAYIEASRVVGQEVFSSNGLEQLARFAFPEFSDQIHAQEVSKNPVPNSADGTSAGLNKYDVYAHDFCTGTSSIVSYYPYVTTTGPTYHSFAMQLNTGDRVYGHVRRYLPKHALVHGRMDVGRRASRAMILLTRHTAGDKFFYAVLRTLETLINLEETVREIQDHKPILTHTLHTIYEKHYRLGAIYNSSRLNAMAPLGQGSAVVKTNANLITIPLLEFQSEKVASVDTINFLIPQTLLHPSVKDDLFQRPVSLIMPLFRCLGISNSLRLFSALLCERRIILVSKSPSRLSACGRAAMAILAQGLLHWQHVFIPVAPTGMIAYLATPVPYLIGVLSHQANEIPKVLGLGEVLVVDLDQNKFQTHNMVQDPNIAIPDLLRPAIENPNGSNNGIGVDNFMGPADILASDLMAILKADKKFLCFGEVGVQEVLGNVAEKGKKLLQRGFGKLKERIMSAASDLPDDTISGADSADGDGSGQDADNSGDSTTLEEHNFTWGEGSENEAAEEEVRIAFTVFFLSLLGDVNQYVPGIMAGRTDLKFDKDLFLRSRKNQGDREGTPIFQLLMIFKETQIFEQFVWRRIEDAIKKKPVLLDSPLFSLALNYHRNKGIPFSVNEIRNTVRQMSQYNSSRFVITWTDGVRKRAMALTSNNRDEAIVVSGIKKLVNDCRESTIILVDVMGVVWERLRTCRGMQWKHGLYGLQLLRELILNGPLSAVSDALEGLGKIKKLMKYENMRTGVTQQIRQAARDISILLMDRNKLFQQRRFLALQRKESDSPTCVVKKEYTINFNTKFSDVHAKFKPSGHLNPTIPTVDLLNVTIPSAPTVDQRSQNFDLLSIQSDSSQVAPTIPAQFASSNVLSTALGSISLSDQSTIPLNPNPTVTGNVHRPPLQSPSQVQPQQQAYYGYTTTPQHYQSAPVPSQYQGVAVPQQYQSVPITHMYPQQAYYGYSATQAAPAGTAQQQYNTGTPSLQPTSTGLPKLDPKNFDPFA